MGSHNIDYEIREIRESARQAIARGDTEALHLSNDFEIVRYVRIADEIVSYIESGRVLDWGCGCGQMSFLLMKRGLDVIPYDIRERPIVWKRFLDRHHLKLVKGDDETILPFKDAYFDAVASIGVLEHVKDDLASLNEIHRVVKNKGLFFIYNLPNRYAYSEFLASLLNIWHHERKYDVNAVRKKLGLVGFETLACEYQNFIPAQLSRISMGINRIYDRGWKVFAEADAVLSAVPILNRISGSISIVARKP